MPRSKVILALGFFIALLPVLGFPRAWEDFFQVAAGLTIVLFSVLLTIDRRLTLKAKAQKRQARKRQFVDVEASLISPESQPSLRASEPFNGQPQV